MLKEITALTLDKMSSAGVVDSIFNFKMVDMPDELVDDLKQTVKDAFSSESNEREIASKIKKHFDETYGPIWHCVVGKSFGAFGTHETKHFVYLYYTGVAIQLWKCG
jgi:dynein light chain LC8-type